MNLDLPKSQEKLLRKRNRINRLSPKLHKVVHESGRSTKSLWMRLIQKSRKK